MVRIYAKLYKTSEKKLNKRGNAKSDRETIRASIWQKPQRRGVDHCENQNRRVNINALQGPKGVHAERPNPRASPQQGCYQSLLRCEVLEVLDGQLQALCVGLRVYA